MRDTIVCGLKFRTWFILFTIAQFSLCAIMILEFSVSWSFMHSSDSEKIFKPNTPSLNFSSSDFFDPKVYSGGMIGCISGCQKVYSDEKSDWCSISDYYASTNSTSLVNQHYYKSLCQLFTNASKAGSWYLVCLSLALSFLFLWFINLCCTFIYKKYIRANYIMCKVLIIVLIIGYFEYRNSMNSNYSSECSEFPTKGKMPILCAGSGDILALLLMIVVGMVLVALYVVIEYAQKFTDAFSPSLDSESEVFNRELEREGLELGDGPVLTQSVTISMQQPFEVYESQPIIVPQGADINALSISQGQINAPYLVDPRSDQPVSNLALFRENLSDSMPEIFPVLISNPRRHSSYETYSDSSISFRSYSQRKPLPEVRHIQIDNRRQHPRDNLSVYNSYVSDSSRPFTPPSRIPENFRVRNFNQWRINRRERQDSYESLRGNHPLEIHQIGDGDSIANSFIGHYSPRLDLNCDGDDYFRRNETDNIGRFGSENNGISLGSIRENNFSWNESNQISRSNSVIISSSISVEFSD